MWRKIWRDSVNRKRGKPVTGGYRRKNSKTKRMKAENQQRCRRWFIVNSIGDRIPRLGRCQRWRDDLTRDESRRVSISTSVNVDYWCEPKRKCFLLVHPHASRLSAYSSSIWTHEYQQFPVLTFISSRELGGMKLFSILLLLLPPLTTFTEVLEFYRECFSTDRKNKAKWTVEWKNETRQSN